MQKNVGRKKTTQAANEGAVAVENVSEAKLNGTQEVTKDEPQVESKETEVDGKNNEKSSYKTEWVNDLYHKDKDISNRVKGEDGKNHLADTVTPLTKGEDGKYHKTEEGQKADCYNVRVPYSDGSGTKFANVNANNISEKGENGKVYSAEIAPDKNGNVNVKYRQKNEAGEYEDVTKTVSLDEFKSNVQAGKENLGRTNEKSDAVKAAMAKGEEAESKAAAEADKSKDAQAEA